MENCTAAPIPNVESVSSLSAVPALTCSIPTGVDVLIPTLPVAPSIESSSFESDMIRNLSGLASLSRSQVRVGFCIAI